MRAKMANKLTNMAIVLVLIASMLTLTAAYAQGQSKAWATRYYNIINGTFYAEPYQELWFYHNNPGATSVVSTDVLPNIINTQSGFDLTKMSTDMDIVGNEACGFAIMGFTTPIMNFGEEWYLCSNGISVNAGENPL